MNKNTHKNTILIVGAGLTGLMCALRLKQINPSKEIIIIEKSDQVGGMYSSLMYMDNIRFDNGMHIIYESCNPEIDDLYREVMPEKEWHIYEGNEKDIAGLFFNGRLQTYSHYVDLRFFPHNIVKSFIGSLFHNLNVLNNNPKSAMDFLRMQFGKEIVEAVHKPILKMMYGVDPENLDIFAVKATALERVILFDPSTMLNLMSSSLLRTRLAFPDQLNLPKLRENSQKALYPKKFGMFHFINRLHDNLVSKGVKFCTQTDVLEIQQHNCKISNVTFSGKSRESSKLDVESVLWTVGWPSLARQLGIDISDISFQKGPEIIFINLVFDRPIVMDRLYYFYCYDVGFASFRITNYMNYCPSAARDGYYPICVELWPSKIEKKVSDLDHDEWVKIVLGELRKFGVINLDHNMILYKIENKLGGFPMPTLENTLSLQSIRKRVEERNISNLKVAGILAKDGLFFLPDILNNAFTDLHEL